MRKVANAFRIGKSTVSQVVRRVTMAICYVMALARVNDLFQFWAVSVHTMPKCFSCRHEKRFGIV